MKVGISMNYRDTWRIVNGLLLSFSASGFFIGAAALLFILLVNNEGWIARISILIVFVMFWISSVRFMWEVGE